ncbi:hypothetical protein MMC17_004901 [Xylographa soralifera]|nr:hypothetical protein [Xylographa soralifera]
MVNIARRTRHLKTLFSIRLGPGAAILPKDVKRIHLDFATKFNDGHLGPRRFFQHCLPRLKYHNPGVSMTVNRTTNQGGPATMTVFFGTSPTSAAPAGTSVNERVQVIDMKHRQEPEILQRLLEVTKAVQVRATEEEELELRAMEEESARSEGDRERNRLFLEEKRRQAALLAQAKASVSASLA